MAKQRQRGNILFLILLAVVLFAALSYAVTNSLRGGGRDSSEETVKAGAAAIQNYVTLLRSEIQRMMLVNGCTTDNLDWRHPYLRYNGTSTSGNANVNALQAMTPKSGCSIFSEYGGPIAAQTFEKYKDSIYENYMMTSATTGFKAGHGTVRWVSKVNEGTEASDIAIYFNGLNPDICSYLLNPDDPPALPNDNFLSNTNPTTAAPIITGADRIENALNLYGDFFVDIDATGGIVYCTLGAILVTR